MPACRSNNVDNLDPALIRAARFDRICHLSLPSAEERERIAVHEAGHAIVARVLDVGTIEKVSILKRGRALGATLVTNDQEIHLQSESQMRSRRSILLGGRCAESLLLDEASTGAANDLKRVSNIAYRMITEFGLGTEAAPFSYAGLPDRDRPHVPRDEPVEQAREIIQAAQTECMAILRAKKSALEALTAQLLEHETVSGSVVDDCLAQERLAAAA